MEKIWSLFAGAAILVFLANSGGQERIVQTASITDFFPKSGTMGSQITLTGTNFSAEKSENIVRINGLEAVVTYATAGKLKVVVPEGATTGKLSLTIGAATVTTPDDYTVADFENKLNIRGLYVLFERRGWASGFYSGDAVNQLHNFDAVVGSTVAQEIALQLDEMKKMGVNTITFELRSSDSYWDPGPFDPPECNIGPVLGLQYPNPTPTEINNLVSFFNLVAGKQMKILLRLINTHMEEQPPANNAIWLNAIFERRQKSFRLGACPI